MPILSEFTGRNRIALDRYEKAMRRLVARSGTAWVGAFVPAAGEFVHYVETGPAGGLPVVLLHGFGAWSFTWRLNLEALGRAGLRTLAPDLRGFGLTTKPPAGGYSLWDQARLVLAWMDALGIRQAVLGGNSLGGEISLRIALLAPERVLGLLLVSSAGYVPMWMPSLARWAVRYPALATPLARLVWANGRFIGSVLRAAYHDPARLTAQDVAGYALPARTPGAARGLLGMLPEMDPGAAAGQFASIRKPALLVWGLHDPWTPLDHGQRLARDLGGAPLEVFRDAGHLPHEEQADRFNDLAVRWLRGLAAGLTP